MILHEALGIVRDQTIPGLRASGGDGHAEAIEFVLSELQRLEYDADCKGYVANLLAVIHHDGGHYLDQHGWKKATDDAIAEVVKYLPQLSTAKIKCRHCGRAVEEARRCYAVPVCYACLPPPRPLPVASL